MVFEAVVSKLPGASSSADIPLSGSKDQAGEIVFDPTTPQEGERVCGCVSLFVT